MNAPFVRAGLEPNESEHPRTLHRKRICRKILRLERRPDPLIDQLRYQVNPYKREAMAAHRLDMHGLAEARWKIGAIEANAGQLNPVCLDLDGRFRKLYVCVRGCQLLLTITVPHGRCGDVVLRGAANAHLLADNQPLLIVRWCLSRYCSFGQRLRVVPEWSLLIPGVLASASGLSCSRCGVAVGLVSEPGICNTFAGFSGYICACSIQFSQMTYG